MTTATTVRSPATDSDAASPGPLNDPAAGDTLSNQNPSSHVCELCPPVLTAPPPLPVLRVEVLLCGRHNHALNDIGVSPTDRARASREQFYTDRDRAARGVTAAGQTWIAQRQPNPLYWVTVDADQYRALHGTAVKAR